MAGSTYSTLVASIDVQKQRNNSEGDPAGRAAGSLELAGGFTGQAGGISWQRSYRCQQDFAAKIVAIAVAQAAVSEPVTKVAMVIDSGRVARHQIAHATSSPKATAITVALPRKDSFARIIIANPSACSWCG